VALRRVENREARGVRLTSHNSVYTLESRATFSATRSNDEPLFFACHSTNEPHSVAIRPSQRAKRLKRSSDNRANRLTNHIFGECGHDERATILGGDSNNEPHVLDYRATKLSGPQEYRATFSRLMGHKNIANASTSERIRQHNLKTLCFYKNNKTASDCFSLGGITQ
jgi:hypothetical protein